MIRVFTCGAEDEARTRDNQLGRLKNRNFSILVFK